MNTTTEKVNKAAEPLEVEPLIEKETIKKVSKKSAVAKPIKVAETKEEIVVVKVHGKKVDTANQKVIRDSFSFPEQDYLKISELKKTCLAAGVHVKKGEILRAGLNLLLALNLTELKQAIENVEKVKTGRPSTS